MSYDVFISYKAEEYTEASWVRTVLTENGITSWMAPECIPGGSSYADEIDDAIKSSSAFVLILSEKAQESKWIKKELDIALNQGLVILPFMIENCQLHKAFNFYLTDVQRYNAYASKAEAMNLIIQRIKSVTDKTCKSNSISTDIDGGKIIIQGKYELNELIGSGGWGTVYLAKDKLLDTLVAIKISDHADGTSVSKAVDMYDKISRIDSKYLLKIRDSLIDRDKFYVVMEYDKNLKPLSLFYNQEDTLHTANVTSKLQRICVLIDVLKGLNDLHRHGIIHADISPENILTNGQETKIIDFSSSFFKELQNQEEEHTITKNCYSAPEKELDERSDLYSVGMIGFNWIMGSSPSRDDRIFELESMPAEDNLAKIFTKAISSEPSNRFQNAQEFCDTLQEYVLSQGINM